MRIRVVVPAFESLEGRLCEGRSSRDAMHRAAHIRKQCRALCSVCGEHKASAGRTVNQMEIQIRKVVQVRSRRADSRHTDWMSPLHPTP